MLLLIDKPSGITSHDAISAVKKHLRQPTRDMISEDEKIAWKKPPKIKIWHAGTLDPLATGLILAATDADTKLLSSLTGADKSYRAMIDFSRASDTWDIDYWKEIRTLDPTTYENIPSLKELEELLNSLLGTPSLPLTPFSAKKVDGKKLYEYAREWNPIFLTVPMSVIGYNIVSYNFPFLEIDFLVWSGTYMRSIAHRVGTQLGGDALLTALRRTSIAEYTLDLFEKKTVHTGQRDEKEVHYIIVS